MNDKKDLFKILLVSAIIFFSCSYIIPFVVYNQKESALVQADLLFEVKKIGISDDLQEIYIKKGKRFGDKKTELEFIFSSKTNFMKLADDCIKKQGWKVIESSTEKKEILMKKDRFFMKLSNDNLNTKLKIYKV